MAVAQQTATTMGWHADVILLDVDLTGAMRLCRATSGAPQATRVIMLSHTSEPTRIVAAIEAGARAWVRKDESIEHLLRVLRGVARGETWLPPTETGNVLSLLMRQRDRRKDGDRMLALLTARERQVLACLAEGDSRNQIAERLNLTRQHGADAPAEHPGQARRPFHARGGSADAGLVDASGWTLMLLIRGRARSPIKRRRMT